jgi:hypothetical protein
MLARPPTAMDILVNRQLGAQLPTTPPFPIQQWTMTTRTISSTRACRLQATLVIKGGKVISSVLRNNGALVTLATGAAEFLAWSKRNDIYLQGKRVKSIYIKLTFTFLR